MEVRPGYMQTEVGVIPADWLVKPIDQISTVGRGRVISHREIARSLNPRYPVYSSQTSNDGVMGYLGTFEFEGEYITWTTDGANAGTVFARNGRFNCTNVCGTIKLKSENYLFVAKILGEIAPRHVSRHLGNPKLMNDVMKQIKVPLPPTKAEQEAIAEALSDADILVESLEQLVAKKRQLKQGAMQELLTGKRRLPGFEIKRGYKQTELGLLPEDWAVAPVGLHLRRTPSYGINAAAVPFDSQSLTYLRITDITDDGRFIKSSKVSVEHPAAPAYLLEPGDIVFARTGASVGKSYLYNLDDGDLVFAGFLIRLSPDPERLAPAFLSFYAQSRPYWNWVKANSTRSGQPGINGREYASLPISLPPTKAEQQAIAAILSDMDAEIAALEAKLAKARQIKQGMMQELLTGRIRLI
jgi:type I restriction enzyme S subunit